MSETAITGDAVLRKVAIRLIPFLFLLYVVNLIDRTNIGIARLQMVQKTPPPTAILLVGGAVYSGDGEGPVPFLSEEAYALGAGLFYIGYLLFEVPSNLILLRVGARIWMARIVATWGLISAAMMFATDEWTFGLLRVLLGFAEAGFFPGIIFYLSQWFPARARARAVATFMTGGVVTSMLGNPLSGLILQEMNLIGGLWGWQWVFLLEGIPSVLLGFVTLRYLTESPAQAKWLTPREKEWLIRELEADRLVSSNARHAFLEVFRDPRVWLLIGVYFTVAVGDNAYGFYVPTFIQQKFVGWSPSRIGLLAAVPSVMALVSMVLVGRHSDRTGERRLHVSGCALTASLGWLILAFAESRWGFVFGLSVTTVGLKSMLPTFWTMPPMFLSGAAAAGGVALINSVANVGGFLGPQIVRYTRGSDGSFFVGFLAMSGVMLAGALLTLSVRLERRGETQ